MPKMRVRTAEQNAKQKLARRKRMEKPEYREEQNAKQRLANRKRMENPEDREKINAKRRRDNKELREKKEKAIQEAREGEELKNIANSYYLTSCFLIRMYNIFIKLKSFYITKDA